MPTIEFNEKTFEINKSGFLLNYEDFCDEWIRFIMWEEEIEELTDKHWQLIKIFQNYFEENGQTPMVRIISKLTKFKMKTIFDLFPSGPVSGACRMAGLPSPIGHTPLREYK